MLLLGNYFFFPLYSSETVNFARPFARRAANTRRPFFVAILSRKPCLFFLFLLEGWNVLFIVLYFYMFLVQKVLYAIQLAKLLLFFRMAKISASNLCFLPIIAHFLSSCLSMQLWIMRDGVWMHCGRCARDAQTDMSIFLHGIPWMPPCQRISHWESPMCWV